MQPVVGDIATQSPSLSLPTTTLVAAGRNLGYGHKPRSWLARSDCDLIRRPCSPTSGSTPLLLRARQTHVHARSLHMTCTLYPTPSWRPGTSCGVTLTLYTAALYRGRPSYITRVCGYDFFRIRTQLCLLPGRKVSCRYSIVTQVIVLQPRSRLQCCSPWLTRVALRRSSGYSI